MVDAKKAQGAEKAVRAIIKNYGPGKKGDPPPTSGSLTRRQPRKIGWDEMLLNNAGNARSTRAANKSKGIRGKSAEYNPLSSASGLTSKPKRKAKKAKT